MAVDPELAAFAAYAAEHGLEVEADIHLPRTTPLLAAGELRSVDIVLRGWLTEFIEARLALVTRGGDGETAERFTVAVTHVPKVKQFVPWMICHRVEDEHLLGRAFGALVGAGERVELESAELDRLYRIHAAPERNDVWLHELFSPSFVVELIERAPSGFAFEYVDGSLCVSVVGRQTLASDLDALREATVDLVRRMRTEVRESLGPAEGRSAPGGPGWPERA